MGGGRETPQDKYNITPPRSMVTLRREAGREKTTQGGRLRRAQGEGETVRVREREEVATANEGRSRVEE